MMAWSTIRRASESEIQAVEAAAKRFCSRHGIDRDLGDGDEMAAKVALDCECDDRPELRRLWRRILKRLTGSSDGIAYGYVGRHVD